MKDKFIRSIDITGTQKQKITKKYESIYGKIKSAEYLNIWISQKGNIMVRHLIEMHEWTNDELIRMVNLGKL